MKEIGVLFKGPLALSNLEGRKTQTRRLVSSPMWSLLDGGPVRKKVWAGLQWEHAYFEDDEAGPRFVVPGANGIKHWAQPRYRVGDRIWQRETWRVGAPYDDMKPSELPEHLPVLYAADGRDPAAWGRSRPSIHMPRWASRFVAEIVDVWGQRIQEISVDDIEAEVVYRVDDSQDDHRDAQANVGMFADLWDSIYGKDHARAWAANPPVWAFIYKRLELEG